MLKSRTQGKRISKRLLIMLMVVLLLLAGAASYYLLKIRPEARRVSEDKAAQAQADKDESFINLNPPTEQEKQETAKHKENLASQTQQEPASSDGKQKVTPVISSATQDALRSYIPGIIEDKGTCTATFTKGTFTFTKTTSVFPDTSYSICKAISLQRSDFATSGTWAVKVSYSSVTYTGESEERTFEVK